MQKYQQDIAILWSNLHSKINEMEPRVRLVFMMVVASLIIKIQGLHYLNYGKDIGNLNASVFQANQWHQYLKHVLRC